MLSLRGINLKSQRGDTLIEVTFALAILGSVLLGSTAIAAAAFRTGQTARERTQVAEVAQQQMEALRSFRDAHTWNEFRFGEACGTGGYCGVENQTKYQCSFDSTKNDCFSMSIPVGKTEWYPTNVVASSSVPTSAVEIRVLDATRAACNYDFEVHYSFTPIGGTDKAENQITTRLTNLKYNGVSGGCLL
jgi:Tfp pilus assembly protein PilV